MVNVNGKQRLHSVDAFMISLGLKVREREKEKKKHYPQRHTNTLKRQKF